MMWLTCGLFACLEELMHMCFYVCCSTIIRRAMAVTSLEEEESEFFVPTQEVTQTVAEVQKHPNNEVQYKVILLFFLLNFLRRSKLNQTIE